jgi:hypothetical protein
MARAVEWHSATQPYANENVVDLIGTLKAIVIGMFLFRFRAHSNFRPTHPLFAKRVNDQKSDFLKVHHGYMFCVLLNQKETLLDDTINAFPS